MLKCGKNLVRAGNKGLSSECLSPVSEHEFNEYICLKNPAFLFCIYHNLISVGEGLSKIGFK